MDPITLVLRASKTPAASAPVGGELSAAEVDANWNNLKTAAEQLDAEKVSTSSLVTLADLPSDPVGTDKMIVIRAGVPYLEDLSVVKTYMNAVATVPSAFVAGNWTATVTSSTAIEVNITTLPSDGGSAITALQYRLNGGTAVNFTGTGTGVRTISGLTASTSYDIEIRAVNAVGNGAWSDVKNRTTSAASNPTDTYIGIASRSGDGAFADFTNPAPASGQRLVVILAGEAFNPRTFTITVNGGGTLTPTEQVAAGDNTTAIFETAAPAGATITIAFTSGGGSGTVNCAVYTVNNGTLRDSATITGASPQSVTLDVAANGLVIAGVSTEWYNGSTLAFTAGVTSDGSNANSFRVGSASGLSANATYTVSATSTVWQPYIVAVTFQP